MNEEVPTSLENKMSKIKEPSMVVQFAVDDKYSIIPMKKIEPFGNVELDKKRSKSDLRGYSLVTAFGSSKIGYHPKCVHSENASQNGSEGITTININLSEMDEKCVSSPFTMLHTDTTRINGIDLKMIIDPGSDSSVATKHCVDKSQLFQQIPLSC